MNSVRALVTAACAAMLPGAAIGCAYHPVGVGSFSASHSASLPVALAVLDAVSSGRLPRLAEAPAPLALLRANGAMRNLSELLAPKAMGMPPVALVLVEAGLWGRITSESGTTQLQTHVDGPLDGDVIVVTGEAALRALLDGSINWDSAVANGLIVVDGPAEGREQLARNLDTALTRKSTTAMGSTR